MRNKLSNFIAKFRTSSTMIFWAALAVVAMADLWTFKHSVELILKARQTQQPLSVSKLVRVNLAGYDAAVKHIQDAGQYSPQDPIDTSPFGLIEKTK